MSNINSDTARGRGIRTAIQGVIGIFVGLVVAVWAVPGVPDVVFTYITANIGNFVALVGLPAASTGIVSWIWNLLRRDVADK